MFQHRILHPNTRVYHFLYRVTAYARPNPIGPTFFTRINRSAFSVSTSSDVTPAQQLQPTEAFGTKLDTTSGRFKRVRKVFFVSGTISLSIILVGLIGFESAHQWVELFGIRALPPVTDEDKAWGWVPYQEDWSGGERGGTDPALGFKVRHLLRAAWMAQHWGIGIDSTATRDVLPRMNSVEIARATLSAQFLAQAVDISDRAPGPPDGPSDHARHQLRLLYAQALEKKGDRDSFITARDTYVQLWHHLSANASGHVELARLANKIGQISSLLNEDNQATQWWLLALDYGSVIANECSPNSNVFDHIPLALPPLPAAQREVISTLMSLLANFTTDGRMKESGQIAEATRQLISKALTSWNDNKSSISHPAAMLHKLFLQHRSSVLTMRLVELSYARTPASIGNLKPRRSFSSKDPNEAWHKQLYVAATTAEYVFKTMGNPPQSTDDPVDFAHSPTLAPAFLPSLLSPATRLQQEAQRTAAEAWNLLGILNEARGGPAGLVNAVEYFQRAVQWSNVQSIATADHTDDLRDQRNMYISNLSRAQASQI